MSFLKNNAKIQIMDMILYHSYYNILHDVKNNSNIRVKQKFFF